VTPDVVVPDDCQRCGACCFGTSRHVRVDGADYARLGEDAEALVEWIGARAFLRLDRSVSPEGPAPCAQLRGVGSGREVGARSPFACTIYERRPTPCRELERGSPACIAVLDAVRARSSP
jgi:uncharacterized protein